MPEFLKDAAFYFDPLSVEEIYQTLKRFINEPEKRSEVANKAFEYVKVYNWETCAAKTFEFLIKVYNERKTA